MYEILGGVRQDIGEIRSWLRGDGRIARPLRIEVAGGRAAVGAAYVEVEALALGVIAGSAEMPFADGGGGVAEGLEFLGNGDLF